MKFKFFLAGFPFGNQTAPSAADWAAWSLHQLKNDPQCEAVRVRDYDDTPITMSRNRAVKEAREWGADLLCFYDSDMAPDAYPNRPGARPFLPTALNFVLNHHGPCAVAAPYCGPPPHENVYAFQWTRRQSDHPNTDLKLDQFTRDEAMTRMGFEEVGAAATGLILYSMKCFDHLAKPYFDYEWTDEDRSQKASTEDVYQTRNLSLMGVPVYVLWDSWAGHWKRKLVGPPQHMTVNDVKQYARDSLARSTDVVRFMHPADGAIAPPVQKILVDGRRIPVANGQKKVEVSIP